MSEVENNKNMYLALFVLVILVILFKRFSTPTNEKSKAVNRDIKEKTVIVHKDIDELFYNILNGLNEKRELTMAIKKISEQNTNEQERLLNEIELRMVNNKDKIEFDTELYYLAYANLIMTNPTKALEHVKLVGVKYKEREEILNKMRSDLQTSARNGSNNTNVPNEVYLYLGHYNARYLEKENINMGKFYIDIYTKLLQKNPSLIHKYKKHPNHTMHGLNISILNSSIEDAMIKCQAENLINECIAFTSNNGDMMLYNNIAMSVSDESGKDVYTWD